MIEKNKKLISITDDGKIGNKKDSIVFHFECISKFNQENKLTYRIKVKIINEYDKNKEAHFEVNYDTIIDALALTWDEINTSDEIFNFNNYNKYLLNKRILSLLLEYLLDEQQNYNTIKSKHQITFMVKDDYLDIIIHNGEINSDIYMNLYSDFDDSNICNIYSYNQYDFYRSEYKYKNLYDSSMAVNHSIKTKDGKIEKREILISNLIALESMTLFEKRLPVYSNNYFDSKRIFINIGYNNFVKSDKREEGEIKYLFMPSMIKFDELLKNGHNNFTVLLADPPTYEIERGAIEDINVFKLNILMYK